MAWVELRLPDGDVVRAAHGDVVGRLASSAVPIDDPWVSEAHALVTLRAGAFRLLPLRGQLAVARTLVREALLAPGAVVNLTPQLALTVTAVQLPGAVLAIEGPGVPRQAVPACCALVTRPTPALSASFVADADAWIWSNGIEWSLRVGAGPPRPLRADEIIDLDGVRFRTSTLPLEAAGGALTLGPALELEPLVIAPSFDLVRITRASLPPATIAGRPARVVSELAAMGGAAPWEVLAREIWPDADSIALRKNLDVTMARLRAKLRALRIRPDLVRPHGNGTFELVLHERDRLVDS